MSLIRSLIYFFWQKSMDCLLLNLSLTEIITRITKEYYNNKLSRFKVLANNLTRALCLYFFFGETFHILFYSTNNKKHMKSVKHSFWGCFLIEQVKDYIASSIVCIIIKKREYVSTTCILVWFRYNISSAHKCSI